MVGWRGAELSGTELNVGTTERSQKCRGGVTRRRTQRSRAKASATRMMAAMARHKAQMKAKLPSGAHPSTADLTRFELATTDRVMKVRGIRSLKSIYRKLATLGRPREDPPAVKVRAIPSFPQGTDRHLATLGGGFPLWHPAGLTGTWPLLGAGSCCVRLQCGRRFVHVYFTLS